MSSLLCATSVFSVSLWSIFRASFNHRDTENTEVAQRNQKTGVLNWTLLRVTL